MSKYLTSSKPVVVELREELYGLCEESIREGLAGETLLNAKKYLEENAKSGQVKEMISLVYHVMATVMRRNVRHCDRPIYTWVSQAEDSESPQVEAICLCCNWNASYGGELEATIHKDPSSCAVCSFLGDLNTNCGHKICKTCTEEMQTN